MKIAIEGMDGVGKTTLAKELCEKYNFKYIERPIKEMFGLERGTKEYEHIDMRENEIYDSNNLKLRAWLTGMGNIYALMQEGDYILDRSYLSNYFWAGNKETERIFETMIDLVGTPDLTVILFASTETRLNRISKRNGKDRDLGDLEVAQFGYDKMSYFVRKFKIPYVAINTENKTPEEVFRETESKIAEKGINLETKEINLLKEKEKESQEIDTKIDELMEVG